MWYWDYYIFCGNTRLRQVGSFRTYDRALASAERAWKKLENTPCICKEHSGREAGS